VEDAAGAAATLGSHAHEIRAAREGVAVCVAALGLRPLSERVVGSMLPHGRTAPTGGDGEAAVAEGCPQQLHLLQNRPQPLLRTSQGDRQRELLVLNDRGQHGDESWIHGQPSPDGKPGRERLHFPAGQLQGATASGSSASSTPDALQSAVALLVSTGELAAPLTAQHERQRQRAAVGEGIAAAGGDARAGRRSGDPPWEAAALTLGGPWPPAASTGSIAPQLQLSFLGVDLDAPLTPASPGPVTAAGVAKREGDGPSLLAPSTAAWTMPGHIESGP
jgi:hypothetical protein